MSYDVSLHDPDTGELLTSEMETDISAVIPMPDALLLNITYRYSQIYKRPIIFGKKGLHILEGMTGRDSIPLLKRAIAMMGNDALMDYWKPTEGNAKRQLYNLLAFAKLCPEGVWKIRSVDWD